MGKLEIFRDGQLQKQTQVCRSKHKQPKKSAVEQGKSGLSASLFCSVLFTRNLWKRWNKRSKEKYHVTFSNHLKSVIAEKQAEQTGRYGLVFRFAKVNATALNMKIWAAKRVYFRYLRTTYIPHTDTLRGPAPSNSPGIYRENVLPEGSALPLPLFYITSEGFYPYDMWGLPKNRFNNTLQPWQAANHDHLLFWQKPVAQSRFRWYNTATLFWMLWNRILQYML